MKPGYTERRKKQTLKLIIVFTTFVALSLAGWLILKTTHVLPANDNTIVGDSVLSIQQNNVLVQDEVLHQQLDSLQTLDEEYSLLLVDSSHKSGQAEISARISEREEAFARSIDSISKQSPSVPNKTNESFFVSMILSFRSALQNRRAISNLRSAISRNNTVLDPAQKEIFTMRNELLAKDDKIVSLETALRTLQTNNAGKSIADNKGIMQENNSLKEKVVSSDNKIAGLTAANASLKKDYDRVTKQLSDAASTAGNDQALKTKYTSLETKVNELSSELSLAQVDCNLSRVDAKQIISNAKQRKMLLSEALSILNGLSKSDNVIIKRKVQQKIDLLNEIATNYRD